MKWGYNWELGPFEVWDALGFLPRRSTAWRRTASRSPSIANMKAAGATSFYGKGTEVFDLHKGALRAARRRPAHPDADELRRDPARPAAAPVLKNDGAEAWDLGDGILGLTFKTKANSIDPDVIKMIGQAAERAEKDFRGMVIANEGDFFCVGANLFLVVMAAGNKQWEDIRTLVKGYQAATQRLKYASVPVVAAPYNMTLGGGLEALPRVRTPSRSAAETYSGLVEVGVGLIPGGGGHGEHAVARARGDPRRART